MSEAFEKGVAWIKMLPIPSAKGTKTQALEALNPCNLLGGGVVVRWWVSCHNEQNMVHSSIFFSVILLL